MKKILITGAGGFVGKNLKEQLEEHYQILAPDKWELDLCDTDAVRVYLEKHNFDVVIHAANYGTVDTSRPDPYKILNYGLRMFYNLAKCCGLYEKMLYFGSGAEFDVRHYVPYMSEEYFGTFVPEDAYGLYKYTIAQSLDLFPNIYDLRLFGICGKYEQYYRFLSSNICRALKKLPLTLSQDAYFDYIFIDDLVQVIFWFIENSPQYKHYNVCRGEHISLKALAELIRNKLCPESELIIRKEGWKKEYSGDNGRLIREVGDVKFTSYEMMVEKLTEYYSAIIEQVDESVLP